MAGPIKQIFFLLSDKSYDMLLSLVEQLAACSTPKLHTKFAATIRGSRRPSGEKCG